MKKYADRVQLKMKSRWFATLSALLLVVTAFYGVRLYKELTLSIQVDVQDGPAEPSTDPNYLLDAGNWDRIHDLLLDAGLNKTPILSDTAVSGHMERLENGKTNANVLQQYAKDLKYLNRLTKSHRFQIPTSFWDVRTAEMSAHQWTEYSFVHRLSQPDWRPYLKFLARGYERFLKFKAEEASGNDTALDAALDMFAFAEEYFETVPYSSLTEHAKEITNEAEAVLMIWQNLVAGTTRINPLTNKPMFSHSIFARDNVGTMYQYDQGRRMSISRIWGVSGFAPRYVGTPENANQIEHMSISIILQMVMHEPVFILDGLEEEKLLAGQVRKEEAYADMALNNAIHTEFSPYLSGSRLETVERLRTILKER